jgi:hypothetical protein
MRRRRRWIVIPPFERTRMTASGVRIGLALGMAPGLVLLAWVYG